MLENWQIKALENDLVNYSAWASHAVSEGIYPDIDSALRYKAALCANRMISNYEGTNGVIENKTSVEKIEYIVAQPTYKNRIIREISSYESTFGELTGMTDEEKIQHIMGG